MTERLVRMSDERVAEYERDCLKTSPTIHHAEIRSMATELRAARAVVEAVSERSLRTWERVGMEVAKALDAYDALFAAPEPPTPDAAVDEVLSHLANRDTARLIREALIAVATTHASAAVAAERARTAREGGA